MKVGSYECLNCNNFVGINTQHREIHCNGLFSNTVPFYVPGLENSSLIKYIDSFGVLGTICPFGKIPKVGSYGCTECKSFISNDSVRNVVVCGGKKHE